MEIDDVVGVLADISDKLDKIIKLLEEIKKK